MPKVWFYPKDSEKRRETPITTTATVWQRGQETIASIKSLIIHQKSRRRMMNLLQTDIRIEALDISSNLNTDDNTLAYNWR
jgi:hypothetical protein